MTYTVNSNSNMIIQSSSPAYVLLNTNTVLESSLLTYTPINTNSKVVYDYTFLVHLGRPSDSDIGFAKLQEYNGSAWVDVSNCVKSFGTTSQLGYLTNIKFTIDSWSGSKQLRLYCGAKASGHNILLYANQYWYGASSNYNKFKCILKVYEI